jgi:hypothetical protein
MKLSWHKSRTTSGSAKKTPTPILDRSSITRRQIAKRRGSAIEYLANEFHVSSAEQTANALAYSRGRRHFF